MTVETVPASLSFSGPLALEKVFKRTHHILHFSDNPPKSEPDPLFEQT
jgi:hypothetical protein